LAQGAAIEARGVEVRDNRAAAGGGAVSLREHTHLSLLEGCVLRGNHAHTGGAIRSVGAAEAPNLLVVQGARFEANEAAVGAELFLRATTCARDTFAPAGLTDPARFDLGP
jgi:hypothetical protein